MYSTFCSVRTLTRVPSVPLAAPYDHACIRRRRRTTVGSPSNVGVYKLNRGKRTSNMHLNDVSGVLALVAPHPKAPWTDDAQRLGQKGQAGTHATATRASCLGRPTQATATSPRARVHYTTTSPRPRAFDHARATASPRAPHGPAGREGRVVCSPCPAASFQLGFLSSSRGRTS